MILPITIRWMARTPSTRASDFISRMAAASFTGSRAPAPPGRRFGVYIERFEPDAARQNQDTGEALADLVALSRDCARIAHYTGREAPTVIT